MCKRECRHRGEDFLFACQTAGRSRYSCVEETRARRKACRRFCEREGYVNPAFFESRPESRDGVEARGASRRAAERSLRADGDHHRDDPAGRDGALDLHDPRGPVRWRRLRRFQTANRSRQRMARAWGRRAPRRGRILRAGGSRRFCMLGDLAAPRLPVRRGPPRAERAHGLRSAEPREGICNIDGEDPRGAGPGSVIRNASSFPGSSVDRAILL